MPFKDTVRHLRDILESIDLINQFVRNMDLPAYDRVSDEIVWNTIQEDLPQLKQIVEKALKEHGL